MGYGIQLVTNNTVIKMPVVTLSRPGLASFPGHVVKFEKSGLVSTVCACAAPQVFLGNLETSGY